ncbi:hypothetical protein DEO72_LG3g2048 [Vigna unguiculata]|uniref:Uncharacterized protein n=1 Tax=Vigna unguiculata TaxID=3917 RepID=A0A4D6LFU9_VIGUN|nr:hypothetical protein DEO72_LG3g2048 [Vigna unguiculata]
MQVRAVGHATMTVVSNDGVTGASFGELQWQSNMDGRPWKMTAAECDGCRVGWCERERMRD